MNLPPPHYEGPFDRFFSQFIEPNLPTPRVVHELHADLRQYVEEQDPIFFLREIDGVERWRRRNHILPRVASGGRIAFTDNSPQWALHALAYRNVLPREIGFSSWLREQMPCHIFDVRDAKLGETLNDAGWHAAHIFAVKDGETGWQSWSRNELIRRFIRNVHPCNLLLLPKTDWQRLGKQADLLAFAVNRYRERYGSALDEALEWMGAAAPEPGNSPVIRYEASTAALDADPNTLILRETSGRRIHLHDFGVRFAGLDGQDSFSVAVELLDGTVFGPLNDIFALELFTRFKFNGEHFQKNKYFSSDYFYVDGGRLRGKTHIAQRLAERLNALRRGAS